MLYLWEIFVKYLYYFYVELLFFYCIVYYLLINLKSKQKMKKEKRVFDWLKNEKKMKWKMDNERIIWLAKEIMGEGIWKGNNSWGQNTNRKKCGQKFEFEEMKERRKRRRWRRTGHGVLWKIKNLHSSAI